jgi:ribosomal protein S14
MSMLEGYLRHGRHYGVDAEFWQAAATDLDGLDLRALARDLGVKLPDKWAADPDGRFGPLPCGRSGRSDRPRPLTPDAASVDTNGCQECGGPVALLSRTGICRRCQWRLGQRHSRSRRSP